MGEKFRSLIERDIAIVLVLIICGLAFSGENGRGFPLPWLSGEGASTVAFLVDLAILGGLVVAIDIFTMIAKGVIRSGDLARSREIR